MIGPTFVLSNHLRVELIFEFRYEVYDMKLLVFASLVCLSGLRIGSVVAQERGEDVPKIIFDTDMGPDYDDVGALAVLHALAHRGECIILATVASDSDPAIAPVIEIFNRYFDKPDIPIGQASGTAPDLLAENDWNDTLITRFFPGLRGKKYPDALDIYRKVLSEQEDHSVTIVTVGFLTNLSRLLDSPPDKFSSLNGMDLVKAKVKGWVAMAGKFPCGTEFNVRHDSAASFHVFKMWPTPVLFSGAEIGAKIFTGGRVAKEGGENNPVSWAYAYNLKTYLKEVKTKRQSWDPITVLCAIRNPSEYFYLNGPGKLMINESGYDEWDPNGPAQHYFISHKYAFDKIGRIIDSLMIYEPR